MPGFYTGPKEPELEGQEAEGITVQVEKQNNSFLGLVCAVLLFFSTC